MERVSNERLEELRLLAAAYNLAQTPQEDRDLESVTAELQAHRARLAQAQQVVDLEGMRGLVRRLPEIADGEWGPAYVEAWADDLTALLDALEAGVQECPREDCEGGVIFPPTGEKCPKCHGSGRGIWLAAKPAEEGDR